MKLFCLAPRSVETAPLLRLLRSALVLHTSVDPSFSLRSLSNLPKTGPSVLLVSILDCTPLFVLFLLHRATFGNIFHISFVYIRPSFAYYNIVDHNRKSGLIASVGLVWPATTVFLNASGVKDGLAALEINCATFDESATSAENLGTH